MERIYADKKFDKEYMDWKFIVFGIFLIKYPHTGIKNINQLNKIWMKTYMTEEKTK